MRQPKIDQGCCVRGLVVRCCACVIVAGMELYTTYEKGSKGFWGAIQTNLAQACYVDSLENRAQVGSVKGRRQGLKQWCLSRQLMALW